VQSHSENTKTQAQPSYQTLQSKITFNSEELCSLKSHSNSEELSQQQEEEEETTTPTPEEILLLLQQQQQQKQPRFKLQNEDCEECRGKYL
jgi:hypothetical protein